MLSALFVLASAATAASPPTAANASADDAAGFSRPASIGSPHSCSEDRYPVSALQTGTQGSAIIAFTITNEGHVESVVVTSSSGNPDLDLATSVCARDWLYRPAVQNGISIAVPWEAKVIWRIGVEEPYSSLAGTAKECLRADSVSWGEFLNSPLRPVVRMHFANGTVTEVAVVGSSGDSDLDTRTLSCYRNMSPGLSAGIPDGDKLLVIMKPNE